MLFEVNCIAGQIILLQHKLIGVIRAAPRFVSEYLQMDYEEKTRQVWGDFILRGVTPT